MVPAYDQVSLVHWVTQFNCTWVVYAYLISGMSSSPIMYLIIVYFCNILTDSLSRCGILCSWASRKCSMRAPISIICWNPLKAFSSQRSCTRRRSRWTRRAPRPLLPPAWSWWRAWWCCHCSSKRIVHSSMSSGTRRILFLLAHLSLHQVLKIENEKNKKELINLFVILILICIY